MIIKAEILNKMKMQLLVKIMIIILLSQHSSINMGLIDMSWLTKA